MKEPWLHLAALAVLVLFRRGWDWLIENWGPCALCSRRAEIRRHDLYYCSVEHAEEGLAEEGLAEEGLAEDMW